MANNQILKDAVSAVIKENGNNEITGALLQGVLLSIINQFGAGAVFAGVAEPSTVPINNDVVAFYIATTNGIYPNFGGYSLSNNDFVIFSNKTGVYEVVAELNVSGIIYLAPIEPGTIADRAELPTMKPNRKYTFEAKPGYYEFGSTEYDLTPDKRWLFFGDGTSWTSVDMGELPTVPVDGVVKEGNTQAVSGGEVYAKTLLPEAVGIEKIPANINLIEDLVIEDINDTDIFTSGYLNSSGDPMAATNYVYTNDYYLIKSGDCLIRTSISSSACIIVYNENKQRIQTIQKVTGDPAGQVWEKNFTLVDGAKYIRFSFYNNQSYLEQCFIKFSEGSETVTDKVFLPTEEFNDSNTANKFNSWGKYYYTPESNFLEELATSDFEDPEIWEDNKFLHTDGSEGTSTSYKYSKQYYLCSDGQLFLNTYFSGNASIVFYDFEKNVLGGFKNPQGAGLPHYEGNIVAPKGTVYVRVSYPDYYADHRLLNLKINPVDFVEIDTKGQKNGISKEDIKRSLRFSYPMPMISFISDDGYSENKDWYVPILDEYGVKSTFAIITNSVGKTGFMTKEEVLQLHADGHDIAGHTHTHPMLRQKTEEERRHELYMNSTILRSWRNDLKARMFIAPYGSVDADVDAEIANYYDADFITNITQAEVNAGGGMNLPPLNRYRIRRLGFDTGAADTSKYTLLTQAVDNLLISGGWLVFTIHPHYGEYTQPNSVDRQQELRDLLAYIQSKNIQILTAQQAFDIYQNRYEIGNKLITPDDYFTIGMDGSEEGVF